MELSRPARFFGLVVAFAALWAASPGVLADPGLWPLAVLGIAGWGRFASAPGRWAFAIELVAAGAGWCALMSWAALVHESSLAFIGPGHGLYFAVQGWALRRLARRLPLALAVPCAWMLFETIRSSLEPPLGVTWMRVGSYAHDALWMSGSARVWGTGGLSWVLVSLAGGLAELWRSGKESGTSSRPWAAVLGLGPLVLAVLLARWVPAPETEDGPRVLLVQPGFEQKRKQATDQNEAMMREQIELTSRGLAEARERGEPEPDLVCWAETMLRLYVADPALADAVAAGAKLDSWRGGSITPELVHKLESNERDWIDGLFFGRRAGAEPILPPGTSFAAGAEFLRPRDGRVRFQNAVFLWPGSVAERRGPATKLHLVPGAETMVGLERFEGVRNVIFELAHYVPDFLGRLPDESVLSFSARDGRTFRFGVAVCFDNAFDDVFVVPVRDADVDFHVVFSNEAWFERSQETEQMLAYSRLAALSTGRSVVRATQSGTSIVFGPDGREVARLADSTGEDEMVRGALRVTVPVPAGRAYTPFAAGTPRPATLFVRTSLAWTALWTAVPLLLLLASLRGGPKDARLPRPKVG
jgi:apolipoprotein N-acyltransferase